MVDNGNSQRRLPELQRLSRRTVLKSTAAAAAIGTLGSGTAAMTGTAGANHGDWHELVIEDPNDIDYGFSCTGEIQKVQDGSNYEAESNDTIYDNGDGTWTCDGFTGGSGYGDTFRFKGDCVEFGPLDGSFTLTLDGTEVTADELVENDGIPMGGGEHYYRKVDSSEATTTVSTLSELQNALSSASSGDIVFVDSDIDTGTAEMGIPGGVTLASDRGFNGSVGARLYTNNAPGAMFTAQGSGVRVTGIQIEGYRGTAEPSTWPSSDNVPWTRGIDVNGQSDVEIDNCNIYGFTYTSIQATGDTRIHHCNIHHNTVDGWGYAIDQSDAGQPVFEWNEFSWNRHSIAAAGGSGNGYTARFNHVTGDGAWSHHFDMHQPGGDTIEIHHNTFEPVVSDEDGNDVPGVTIREDPSNIADMWNNWFYNPKAPKDDPEVGDRYRAITQMNTDPWEHVESWQNVTFSNNAYGSSEPADEIGHPRNLNVDQSPSCSIASPSDGATVSGTETIQISASDAEDDDTTLTVEVSIDGGTWQSATYNSSTGYYEYDWDTTAESDGGYTIDARATDSNSATTNASGVSVTVDNVDDPAPTPVIDDLERSSPLAEYGGAADQFSVETSTVYEGSQAVTNASGSFYSAVSTSGLDRYPRRGDEFTVYFNNAADDNFMSVHFFAQSESDQADGYQAGISGQGAWKLWSIGDPNTSSAEIASTDLPSSDQISGWYRVEVSTDSTTVYADLYDDANDTLLASVQADNTTWSEGGFGFRSAGNGEVWDYVFQEPIEDFERSSPLAEYGGSTGAFSVETSTVFEGGQALVNDSGNFNGIASTSGLDAAYPERGDTVTFFIDNAADDNYAAVNLLAQSEGDNPNSYSAGLSGQGAWKLWVIDDNGVNLVDEVSLSSSDQIDGWYRVEMWTDSTTVYADLYDHTNDSLIASVQADDQQYSSGGIGFRSAGNGEVWDYVYR